MNSETVRQISNNLLTDDLNATPLDVEEHPYISDASYFFDKQQEHEHTIECRALKAWVEQQKEDRKLRKDYSKYLMWTFWAQLFIMYIVLFLIALGCFSLTNEQFIAFFVTVFAEITALVAIVTRYLFSNANSLNISDLFKK